MNHDKLAATIDAAWETRDRVTPATKGDVRDAIEAALDGLDSGTIAGRRKERRRWHVHNG